MRLKPIAEQVVVVVGASSGIGRETALQFARRGARIVVAAQDEHGLASLVREIERGGGQAVSVVADVASFDQVRAIGQQAVQAFGRLDSWIHCAAVGLWATFEQTAPEEFERVVTVNLLGQVYGAMVALPLLRRTGHGALIHVSSIEAKRAFPFHSAYSAAKHGIDGFLEALRVELAHEGVPINVVQILPASVNTPLFDKAKTKIGVKPKGIPPIYEPSSVVEAILYAAEHPARDLVVGGAGQALIAGQRLSPRLLDQALHYAGFRSQMTEQPKSPEAPNNLFGPLATTQYDRATGNFGAQARPSLATWFEVHPKLTRGLAAAVLGVVAALRLRGSGRG
jgi:NAD(P)-dependent dehydrogenase (short-subunit alcohol dehydrogenase family)